MPDDATDEATAAELDPAFYEHGGVSLSDEEQAVLGDLHARRVLMLGAGNGEDAASLANLGADVTIVDETELLVEARALAQSAHLSLRFVEGSVADPPASIRTGGFDLVYSGFGAISWIPDLDAWAAAACQALEHGGSLVVYDEHPFALTLSPAGHGLAVAESYFGDEPDTRDDESHGPRWTLGDIITAIGSAGFAVELLQEYPESERFATVLDDFADEVPAEVLARVPGVFLLKARLLA